MEKLPYAFKCDVTVTDTSFTMPQIHINKLHVNGMKKPEETSILPITANRYILHNVLSTLRVNT